MSADNAAPVPNESVTAPPDRSGQETSVAPAVMQIHYPHLGDGYTEGSSAQAMDDREAAKVTGVQMRCRSASSPRRQAPHRAFTPFAALTPRHTASS